jgi:hypothetical protein
LILGGTQNFGIKGRVTTVDLDERSEQVSSKAGE